MSDAPAPSLVERVQDFVSENKRAVLLGAAAVIAVGGVAYYAASTSRGGVEGDVEKAERKEKKRSNKSKSKKKKTVKDDDGPLLEERKPKVEVVEEEAVETVTDEEVAAMNEEQRNERAASYKKRGNDAYNNKNFAQAVELYTLAIKVSPIPQPVFYSNRAACYANFKPPQNEKVIADCNQALTLDHNYIKALNRRATACENLLKYEDALRDYTAATILDKFQNSSTSNSVERILKLIAETKAREILATREPRLPSYTFIASYFAAFRPRAPPTLPENPSQGDQTLLLGVQALEAGDYAHAVTFVNEAIEQGISFDQGKAEALNLRGTFKFLMGDVDGAGDDFEESLKIVPTFTQSLVKIASVHMEKGDSDRAFERFNQAVACNPNDPDIYYHRGQVLFIMNKFEEAAENYIKSTELDENFVFSHIQLAVAYYKMSQTAKSMATFRSTLRKFPERSEPYNYYGELLLDQNNFDEAVQKFDRAVEIENSKTRPNVLPLVNKGLALYQMKQDIGAAERCCNEALRIDNECEAALATLAQLSLQQSRIEDAAKLFERQAKLARSEPELMNAITYQYATQAQVEFLKNYPEKAQELAALAHQMM
ncbi:mitochondrial outer membrane translocase receptor TOM70 [Crucibulum laeve]|uniref:Mitochondrial outer membrane translocase receptor TOM70 n=1 Tax=Crucibulum laeve TaxID=68775 RepID=A0A5C3LRJ3_9AGAR|nr:mitochondrial outer membrane translocase receptor TOM70 [Crucibulum laeve]